MKARDGERVLDIVIGPAEAMAIGFPLRSETMPRPMTHDFIKDLLKALDDVSVIRVVLTKVEEGTFFANLELRHGDRPVTVDCRPSDAITVAIRLGVPILATQELDDFFDAA